VRARLVAVTAVLLLGASFAHAAEPTSPLLLQSDPAAGAHLETAPSAVTLTFDQPLDSHYSRIEVFNACKQRVDKGELTVTATQMSISLPRAYAGPYKVYYAANATPKGATGETSGYLNFTVHKGKRCR
jgi:methionine-rich copper-binding protein CopC